MDHDDLNVSLTASPEVSGGSPTGIGVNHRKGSRTILALLAAVILLLLVWAICTVAGALTTVKSIAVEGESPYTQAAVAAVAGIEPGMKQSRLDKQSCEAKILKKLPYISKVSVRFGIGGKVRIKITADKARYITYISGDCYVMSSDFRMLEMLTSDPLQEGVVYISLPKAKRAMLGSVTEYYSDSSFVGQLMHTLDESFLAGRIKSVDASDKYDIEFKFDDRYTVMLGELRNIEGKLKMIAGMLENKALETPGNVVLDVSDLENATVRFTD